ncbi:MAG TPA: hypothetical protein VK698_21350 [Kofleriaceae bacterium]|nr:hypothetical protein [Kofleriaceae bacterium]
MPRRNAIATALSLVAAAAAFTTSRTASADAGSLGVMVDAGVPDGFTGSLVFRPLRPLHVHAGVGTNLISYGVRAGASLYMLPFAISPTLNAEVGHYFPGDANQAANRVGISSDSNSPLLREVGYDYANLHLGADFGRDRVSLYLHAGITVMRGTLHHLDEVVAEGADDGLTFAVNEDATARIIAPSARVGFLFFF